MTFSSVSRLLYLICENWFGFGSGSVKFWRHSKLHNAHRVGLNVQPFNRVCPQIQFRCIGPSDLPIYVAFIDAVPFLDSWLCDVVICQIWRWIRSSNGRIYLVEWGNSIAITWRVVGSTLHSVGSGRRSIVAATIAIRDRSVIPTVTVKFCLKQILDRCCTDVQYCCTEG